MTTSRPNEANPPHGDGATQEVRAQVVLPTEYTKRLGIRLAGWIEVIAPGDILQEFYVQQAVIAGMRIERSQTNATNRLIELAEIAADPGMQWERNRKSEALALGETLKRNPARVTTALRQTPAGRDWLIAQWRHLLLGVIVEGKMQWTADDTETAIDLMGLPKTMRQAMTDLQERLEDRDQLRKLIHEEITKLNALQSNITEENAAIRARHRQGLGVERDTTLKEERRSEAAAQRHLAQALKAIKDAKAIKTKEATPTVQPQTATVVPTPTETKPMDQVVTPPTEIGEVPTAVVPPTAPPKGNRKCRRKQQAQARHEGYLARRRAAA